MKTKIISVFTVSFIIMAAYIGGRAWERYCIPQHDVSVFVNGRIESNASAYKCPNGLVVVQIPDQASVLLDLDDLSSSSIPGTQFHNIFGFIFAHDPEPAGVLITDRVKIDPDLNVVVSERSIEYDDLISKERIHISIEK